MSQAVAADHVGQERWVTALQGAAAAAIQSGEIPTSTDIDQFVFELQAFQGAANVAAAENDRESLARARRAVRERIGPTGREGAE